MDGLGHGSDAFCLSRQPRRAAGFAHLRRDPGRGGQARPPWRVHRRRRITWAHGDGASRPAPFSPPHEVLHRCRGAWPPASTRPRLPEVRDSTARTTGPGGSRPTPAPRRKPGGISSSSSSVCPLPVQTTKIHRFGRAGAASAGHATARVAGARGGRRAALQASAPRARRGHLRHDENLHQLPKMTRQAVQHHRPCMLTAWAPPAGASTSRTRAG